MLIRKLYLSPNLIGQYVLETLDGKFMAFYYTPWRPLEEKDLHPMPGYRAIGKCAEEAPWYIYRAFDLEKVMEVKHEKAVSGFFA